MLLQCEVHRRHLTYYEAEAGGCFWCDSTLVPAPPKKADGKWWERRKARWGAIKLMTDEDRAALAWGSRFSLRDATPDEKPAPAIEAWVRGQLVLL